jgi:hypothetical protein
MLIQAQGCKFKLRIVAAGADSQLRGVDSQTASAIRFNGFNE